MSSGWWRIGIAVAVLASCGWAQGEPVRFARYELAGAVHYGVVEGEQIRRIDGDLFGTWHASDSIHPLTDVKLLVPTEPRHVIAMAGNYRSHAGGQTSQTTITTTTVVNFDPSSGQTSSNTNTKTESREAGEVPAKFRTPQPFFKPPSCLIPHLAEIEIPRLSSGNVHYEAELVIVMGKRARNVLPSDAAEYILGVTCGNDVSERDWQKNDVQWWRAKGSDTFGPCGPFVVSGLDYDNLLLQLRLNDEVVQSERTSHLIHNVPATVSFVSEYVTLLPGDLIFTGTPGTTARIRPGDVVEVELEGVGVLRNYVKSE